MTPESPRGTQVGRLTLRMMQILPGLHRAGHGADTSPTVRKYPVAQSSKERFHLTILPPQAAQAQIRICIKKSNFSTFFQERSSLALPFPGLYELQVYGRCPYRETKEILYVGGNMKPLSDIAKLLSSSQT